MKTASQEDNAAYLSSRIVAVPDFPRPGIIFRDITPVLGDARAFKLSVESLASLCPVGTEFIAGIESRGFIFGSAVAASLGCGFVPIRKSGRLPRPSASVSYELEYGSDTLEVHRDALGKGAEVVIIDDLLATGGTMTAAAQLIEKIGGRVSRILFLVELSDLGGREKLPGREVKSLVTF